MKRGNKAIVIAVVAALSVVALFAGIKAGNNASADASGALKETKPRMVYFYAPW